MTRKDYILIANALAAGFTVAKISTRSNEFKTLINSMSDRLIVDNPRHDRERFYDHIVAEMVGS